MINIYRFAEGFESFSVFGGRGLSSLGTVGERDGIYILDRIPFQTREARKPYYRRGKKVGFLRVITES